MNETIKTIFDLKTTRSNNFCKKKITDKNFNLILESCCKAPNASNRQSYSIIILDEKQKEQLGLKGDRALLFLVDFYRHEVLKEKLAADISFSHFQPFLTGIIDVSLAVENAVIAANSLGISYLVTNDTYTKHLNKIFDLFKLPKTHCFPLLYLCLGYPKTKNVSKKSRLDIKHIIHFSEYRKYSQDEILSIINDYDNANLELFTNWNEKGYKSYLHWFYTKWITALEKQEKSEKLLELIKKIGFLK